GGRTNSTTSPATAFQAISPPPAGASAASPASRLTPLPPRTRRAAPRAGAHRGAGRLCGEAEKWTPGLRFAPPGEAGKDPPPRHCEKRSDEANPEPQHPASEQAALAGR